MENVCPLILVRFYGNIKMTSFFLPAALLWENFQCQKIARTSWFLDAFSAVTESFDTKQ